jgi:hypothetical protein
MARVIKRFIDSDFCFVMGRGDVSGTRVCLLLLLLLLLVTIGTTTSRSILLPGKSMDQNRAAYFERRIFVLLFRLLSSLQIIDT